MGIFLYNNATKNPFETANREELIERLKEVLLDFGECKIEKVELIDRQIYLIDPENLRSVSGEYILSFNRFEKDAWETSNFDMYQEKFTGITGDAKIGWKQHYKAMAIGHVLCECYSDGKYMVYGNINRREIIHCLIYIAKRYGLDLVEKFLDNRLDIKKLSDKENWEDLLIFGDLQASDKIYLMDYIKKHMEDDEDYSSNLIEDPLLDELIRKPVGTEYSEDLNIFIENIFSKERKIKYQLKKREENTENDYFLSLAQLMDLVDSLCKNDGIFVTKKLFYNIFKILPNKEGKDLLDEICFYISDLPDVEQREAYVWIMGQKV